MAFGFWTVNVTAGFLELPTSPLLYLQNGRGVLLGIWAF